jgi:hypothetical protein
MRVKKSEKGSQIKPTADSTGYYSRKLLKSYGEKDFAGAKKASDDVARQSKKGKPGYDANGFPIKKKNGGSLKPVDSGKNPGLAKLPTPVRNKMGYQKDGGKLKAKSGAALKKQAAKAIAMKKAGKSPKKMMGGGKCKYGC